MSELTYTPNKVRPWLGTLHPVNPVLCEHIPGLSLRGREAYGTQDQLEIVARRHGRDVQFVDTVTTPLGVADLVKDLRDYQVKGVKWLMNRITQDGGALLADDMGLGKSLQTIVTWSELGRPQLLIVCPASVRRTWTAQFKKWMGMDIIMVEKAKDLSKVERDSLVVVTSYEMCRKLPAGYVARMLVLDEAHKLRSRGTQAVLHLRELAPQMRYRLGLTGTPMWGYNRDLWNLLQTLFGYRFGTADDYDYAYCGAFINKWGGKENRSATRTDELKARLSYVMLRRTKRDVKAELPAFTRDVRYCDPLPAAREFMKRAALKQCSFQDALAATLTSKVQPVVEAVLSTENALVITWRKEDVRAIKEALEEEGRTVRTITGEDSHKLREATVMEAAKLKCDVVATIDSTGTGVDGLQHVTSNGFFHALDYTPIKMLQCEARLHRGGQEEPVNWTYFVMRDSADEIVKTAVIDKLANWEATMGTDDAAVMSRDMSSGEADEEAALAAIYEELLK